MGCMLGESERWEEAHKISNTVKSDVSGVGIRERLGGGQELVLVVGVKRKMSRKIYHTVLLHLLCCASGCWSIQTDRYTERTYNKLYS